MLRFVAAENGSIAHVIRPEPGYALPDPPHPNELDVDAVTNPDILVAWDTDSLSFALEEGVLTRNGAPVTINPPAPPEPTQAERVIGALLEVPELSDSSKARLVAALGGGG